MKTRPGRGSTDSSKEELSRFGAQTRGAFKAVFKIEKKGMKKNDFCLISQVKVVKPALCML